METSAPEITPGESYTIQLDITIDGVLVLKKGDQVVVQGINPNPDMPAFKYTVFSSRVQQNVDLRRSSLILTTPSPTCGTHLEKPTSATSKAGWFLIVHRLMVVVGILLLITGFVLYMKAPASAHGVASAFIGFAILLAVVDVIVYREYKKEAGKLPKVRSSKLDDTSVRRLGSRRISPLVIIIGVLLIIAAIAIAGTLIALRPKDDSHEAIGLIEKADPLLSRSVEKWAALSPGFTNLFTSIKNMSSSAQYEAEAGKLLTEIRGIESDLNTTQHYLSDVSTLKGAKPYKDFAEASSGFTNIILQEGTLIREYLDYVGTQIKRAEAGQPVDSPDVTGGVWSALIQKLQQLDEEANAFREKAVQMYDSLNMQK